MKLSTLFCCLIVTQSIIPPGSLSGFYKFFEIEDIFSNLLINQPSPKIATNMSIPGVPGISITPIYHFSGYEFFKILIIGGFYAGYPMSAYQVLYTAYNLISGEVNSADESKITKSLKIDLIPVINVNAYQKSEQLYSTTNSFAILKTDLSGESWGCNSIDAGINPYYNFPYK